MNRKAFSLVEISIVIVIVGILISGISAGVGMYKEAVLASARTLTINSRVQRIDGLVLWLETTLGQSFDSSFKMQNGQRANPWKNLLLNSNIAINSGWPLDYYNDTINNLPAITTANQSFSYNASNSVPFSDLVSDEGTTIFAVLMCRPYTWWNGTGMPCGSPLGIVSNSQNFKIMVGHKWGNLSFGIGGVNKSWVSYGLADNKVNNVPNIFAFRADSSKLSIRLNGKKVAETNTTSSIIPDKELYSVWIGYATADVGSWSYSHYKGWIGEIIIVKKPISDDIIIDVENYLSKKWKIKLSN